MKTFQPILRSLLSAALILSSTNVSFAARTTSRGAVPAGTAAYHEIESRFAGERADDLASDLQKAYEQEDQRQEMDLVLKAATANPYAAAGLLFNTGLDEASADAAARTVLKIREQADHDPALTQALEKLQHKVWGQDDLATWDNEGLKRKQSGAFGDFANVLAAARGSSADMESAVRLWKTGYDGAATASAAPAPAAPAAEPVVASAPKAARGRKSGLKPASVTPTPPAAPADAVPSPAKDAVPAAPAPVAQDIGRVTSFNFDIDGNILNLPTQIILFKGSEPLGVDSIAFRGIQSDFKRGGDVSVYTGTDPKYKGFEIRPKGGSFDKFGTDFVADLKNAVENLPKSTWQGPSFDALAWALSHAETAKYVTFDTMRPGDHILEGLKYLKDLGYFKYLPPEGSVYTARDADDKADFLAKKLDEIDKVPLGANAPKVLDQDGTEYKALHLDGFSDDTAANFLAAARKLGAEVKNGRWKNVKITVIYTGPDQKDLTAGAYVIKSNGELRAVTADEHGEGYIEHVEQPGTFRKPKFKPLPYPKVRRSTKKTLSDAITKMWVSHEFETAHPKVTSGADLGGNTPNAVEREAIRAFVHDTKIPDPLKRIRLDRYSVDDPALADVMIEAMKKGIVVEFSTDFNTSMDFDFKEGMHEITDFSKGRPKNDPGGKFIQKLLDAGFKIAQPGVKIDLAKDKGVIYSQPLYNKGDAHIDPIMHEKSTLLITEADPSAGIERHIDYYFGTNNLTKHQRYNRLFLINEQVAAEYANTHFDKLAEAFSQGKIIAKIESEPPLRIYFEDDSYMELAYTNGQYNPNQRKVDRKQRGLDDPKSFIFKKLLGSQFAPTFSPDFDILGKIMKIFTEATVQQITDRGFIDPTGFGKTAQMSGVALTPEFGKGSFGWAGSLVKRVMQWVFIQQSVDPETGKPVVTTDADGAPIGFVIWHDKTDVESWLEQGIAWTYIDTGSLNKSGHADNAELQVTFRFHSEDPFVQAVEDSILKVIAKNPTTAIPIDPGLLQIVFARMLGHNETEVPTQAVKDIEQAILKADAPSIKTLGDKLTEIAESKTTLKSHSAKLEEAKERIRLFTKFVDWYNNELPKTHSTMHPGKLWFAKTIALAVIVGHPKLKAWDIHQLLNKILWNQDVPNPEELEKLIAEAWKVLEIKQPMPDPKAPQLHGAPSAGKDDGAPTAAPAEPAPSAPSASTDAPTDGAKPTKPKRGGSGARPSRKPVGSTK